MSTRTMVGVSLLAIGALTAVVVYLDRSKAELDSAVGSALSPGGWLDGFFGTVGGAAKRVGKVSEPADDDPDFTITKGGFGQQLKV